MRLPGKIIMQGITGSKAYGLDTPTSDTDIKGVFVEPTLNLVGLNKPDDTHVSTGPDLEYHELGKFLKLALQCNPSVIELMWLDDYQILETEFELIRSIRTDFLSTGRVIGAYGGYAMSQIKRLQDRGDGSFSSDTRKRTAKHARHLFRLLDQGMELLTTGGLHVRVANRDELFALGEMSVDKIVEEFHRKDTAFRLAEERSVLPDQPDYEKVDIYLRSIRQDH